jgi:hypothetical protein
VTIVCRRLALVMLILLFGSMFPRPVAAQVAASAYSGTATYSGWKALFRDSCPVATAYGEGAGLILPLLTILGPPIIKAGFNLIERFLEKEGKPFLSTATVRGATDFYKFSGNAADGSPQVLPNQKCLVVVRGAFADKPVPEVNKIPRDGYEDDPFNALRGLNLIAVPEFYLELRMQYSGDGRHVRFEPVHLNYAGPEKPRFFRDKQYDLAVKIVLEPGDSAELALTGLKPPTRFRAGNLDGISSQWTTMPTPEKPLNARTPIQTLGPTAATVTVAEAAPGSDVLMEISGVVKSSKEGLTEEIMKIITERLEKAADATKAK